MPFLPNRIIQTLDDHYREEGYRPAKKLVWKGDDNDAWRVLIAVILSANVHDRNVEQAVPQLFKRYPTPDDLAYANQKTVEGLIRSTGYFRQKASAIISTSRDIVERFAGKVPESREELVSLRGVGRKTANVVLSAVFGIPSLAVDTHVNRVANRLGLASSFDPFEVEQELTAKVTMSYWSRASHYLVLLGRDFCDARKPNCRECPVAQLCEQRMT